VVITAPKVPTERNGQRRGNSGTQKWQHCIRSLRGEKEQQSRRRGEGGQSFFVTEEALRAEMEKRGKNDDKKRGFTCRKSTNKSKVALAEVGGACVYLS